MITYKSILAGEEKALVPLIVFTFNRKMAKRKQLYLDSITANKLLLTQEVLDKDYLNMVPAKNLFLVYGDKRFANVSVNFNDLTRNQVVSINPTEINEFLFSPKEYFDTALGGLSEIQKHVLLSRSQKKTLEVIGNEKSVTRERIRQIEKKAIELLDAFSKYFIFLFLNSKNYIDFQKIEMYFNTEELKLIHYILKNNNYLSFDSFSKKLIVNDNFTDTIRKDVDLHLSNKNVIDYEDVYRAVNDSNNKGNIHLEFSDIETYLFERKYKKVENQFINTSRVAPPYSYVIKNFFPEGISLNQLEPTADFIKLSNITSSLFDVKVTHNPRSLYARIIDDLAPIDRSLFIHRDLFVYDHIIINKISEFIDEADRSTFYFAELFSMFENELLVYSGISNRYSLRSALLMEFGDYYEFSRDSITKLGQKKINMYERMEIYIKDNNRPVKVMEIQNYFEHAPDTMVYQVLKSLNNIISWGFSMYIHKDNVPSIINVEDINKEIKTLLVSKSFISVEQFIQVVNKYNDFSKFNIDPNLDFDVLLDYYFKNLYCLSEGVVWNAENFEEDYYTRLYLYTNTKIGGDISINSLDSFSHQYGLTYQAKRKIINQLVENCIRKNSNLFHPYEFQIEQDDINNLHDTIDAILLHKKYATINEIMENGYFVTYKLIWNPETIISIIRVYLKDKYEFIPTGVDKLLTTYGVIVKANLNQEIPEVIFDYLRSIGVLSVSEFELDKFLSDEGITPSGLTDVFYSSKRYKKSSNFFILEED